MICGRGGDRNFYIEEDGVLEFWKSLIIPIDDKDGEDILINDNNKNYIYLVNGVLGILIRNNFNPFIEFIDKG